MVFVTLYEAMHTAQLAANVYGLPQTVFRTGDTHGWANTNPFASFLSHHATDIHVTMLPQGYFA
ncbi:hypothetical protein M0D69_13880 [Caballeronia sp. SEWSISQ10-4 2]|uniref:hypothetical protein n=1 Tax=Caballeronia sp. SEWSISQ10-4 2 TaxID=2937438 RepID=UPI002653A01C|nr:hypothetical protein [Caballeronia sp. SEWSISQ10-4 2]MDN7179083.1 hypothetical protein [Caballeronia sp. SEWSISQ10-4 2]